MQFNTFPRILEKHKGERQHHRKEAEEGNTTQKEREKVLFQIISIIKIITIIKIIIIFCVWVFGMWVSGVCVGVCVGVGVGVCEWEL